MSTSPEYFDVNNEPANFQGHFASDPSEHTVGPIDGHEDEISTIRDSVTNEPVFTGQLKQADLAQWLAEKRAQCTFRGNITVTLTAALAAGPFAILGAFMTDRQTAFGIVYSILFGPVVEELLKQSGMIYLLEKRPYRIFTIWQFIIAAVIASLVFATIENLLYINVYVNTESLNKPLMFVCYRWTVCTLLHVTCSVIASFGLIRVWKKQLSDGRAADLAYGFRFFAAAMTLHGLYNLTMVLLTPKF